MTKIDIISGFLGAGKTTLIKKLLADALKGQQVVLIENEFGEIGIDGGFLKEAGIEIREMNSGCICCSLVGDFGTALTEVIEKYHPDRIIIEPSGVGKLSDVIHAVEGIKTETEVVLNCATTVVDVTKCKMYLRNFGEFFKNQVEAASTIILSRTDTEKATEEKVEAALALLRELNPDATIITTPVEELDGKKVLDTMEGVKIDLSHVEEEHEGHHHHEHDENCTCGCHDHEHHHHDHESHHNNHEHHHHDHEHHHHHDHHHGHDHDENCTCGCHDHHHHHHHADEVFTSWGRETIKKFDQEQIRTILEKLSDEEEIFGIVLRAKGMVAGKDGHWIYFDMVPGEADVREGSPEYTGRICVIGSKLAEDKLQELFGI
jgi:G3E family GTPase